MSEQEPISHDLEQKPGKIGVSYGGIMAEKMQWKYHALANIETAGDLRTTIGIRNQTSEDNVEVSEIGDTLIMRQIPRAEDFFSIRRSPERFLTVGMDFSTARAEVIIDDQGIANSQLKNGKFEEDVFVSEVDRLTRKGIRSIMSKEKKSQAKDSTVVLAGVSATLAPLALVFPAWGMVELQAFVKIVRDNDITGHVESISATLLAVLFSRGYVIALEKYASGYMDKLGDRFKSKHLNYIGTKMDMINPMLHLNALNHGKKALKQSVVEKTTKV